MQNRVTKNCGNTTFYYIQSKIPTIIALKNLPEISRSFHPKQYIWLDNLQKHSLQKHNEMKLQLMGIKKMELVGTLEEARSEILGEGLAGGRRNVDVVCTWVGMLEDLCEMVRDLGQVQTVWFFLFEPDEEDFQTCFELMESNRLGSKFVITDFDELKKQLKGQHQDTKLLPNFCFLGSDNTKLNTLKTSLNLMAQQQFDHTIMSDRMNQMMKSCTKQQSDLLKLQGLMAEMRKNQNYVDIKKIIQYYTCQSFLYKVVNNLLRKGFNPTELFYIQPFVKNLFFAIARLYNKQIKDRRSWIKREFQCYRGAKFSPAELEEFSNNVGECIECLGFMSTTTDRNTAFNFGPNTIIVIDVGREERDFQLDYGYAYVAEFSETAGQAEVLFNMLNSFTIKSVQKLTDKLTEIRLEYGTVSRILFKQKKGHILTDDEKRIFQITKSQRQKMGRTIYQGHAVYSHSINTETEFQVTEAYLKIERDIYESIQDRTLKQNLFYLLNLWMKARICSIQNKLQEAQQAIGQCQFHCKKLMGEHPNQLTYKDFYYDAQRVKVEILISAERYDLALRFIDETLEYFGKQPERTIDKAKFSLIISSNMFKTQCLFCQGKREEARIHLRYFNELMHSSRQKFPQIYESFKIFERNRAIHGDQNDRQRMKKLKYIIGNLCSLSKVQKNLLPFLMSMSMDQLNDEQNNRGGDQQQYHLLRIARLMFQVEQLWPKYQKNQPCEFNQKFQTLLLMLKTIPQYLKKPALYNTTLFKTSTMLFNLHRYKESLLYSQQYHTNKISLADTRDAQFLLNLARICKFKIALNELYEAAVIREELVRERGISEIEDALGEIDLLFGVKEAQGFGDAKERVERIRVDLGCTVQQVEGAVYFLGKFQLEMNPQSSPPMQPELSPPQEMHIKQPRMMPQSDQSQLQPQQPSQIKPQLQNQLQILSLALDQLALNNPKAAISLLSATPSDAPHLETRSQTSMLYLATKSYLRAVAFSFQGEGEEGRALEEYARVGKFLRYFPVGNLEEIGELKVDVGELEMKMRRRMGQGEEAIQMEIVLGNEQQGKNLVIIEPEPQQAVQPELQPEPQQPEPQQPEPQESPQENPTNKHILSIIENEDSQPGPQIVSGLPSSHPNSIPIRTQPKTILSSLEIDVNVVSFE